MRKEIETGGEEMEATMSFPTCMFYNDIYKGRHISGKVVFYFCRFRARNNR